MILDSGICSIYSATNGAPAGNKPIDELALRFESMYGELSFELNESYPTQGREEVATTTRVRVLQHRGICNRDAAFLSTEPGTRYEVTRVFHGRDDDSGELITDLNLHRVE